MQTYLIVYRPGPAWLSGQPISAQPLKGHGQFLLGLYQLGQLRLAGPFRDDTGGALVLEASNEEQARTIIQSDPAVADGVFTYTLHPWTLLPWERYVNGSKEQ
jgi:uncharacterized protein YciI